MRRNIYSAAAGSVEPHAQTAGALFPTVPGARNLSSSGFRAGANSSGTRTPQQQHAPADENGAESHLVQQSADHGASHALPVALPATLAHERPRYVTPFSSKRLSLARAVAEGAAPADSARARLRCNCPGMLPEHAPIDSKDAHDEFTRALLSKLPPCLDEGADGNPSTAAARAATLAALTATATRLGSGPGWSASGSYMATFKSNATTKKRADINVNHLLALFALVGIGTAKTLKLYALRVAGSSATSSATSSANSMAATLINGKICTPVALEPLATLTCDWDGHPGEPPVCGCWC